MPITSRIRAPTCWRSALTKMTVATKNLLHTALAFAQRLCGQRATAHSLRTPVQLRISEYRQRHPASIHPFSRKQTIRLQSRH
jgi:hypothetical protein